MGIMQFLCRLFPPRAPTEAATGGEAPPELAPAIAALQAGRAAEALELARPSLKSRRQQTRSDALRISALACSELAQWDAANLHFMRLSRLELNVHNLLQVATTALMRGAPEDASRAFDQATALNLAYNEMPQARLHTAFLSAVSQSGQFAAGLPHLELLRSTFQAAPTLDDTFLYMHGLPFFGAFLDKSLPILQACLSPEEVRAWYRLMHDDLADDGRQRLDAWLASLPA